VLLDLVVMLHIGALGAFIAAGMHFTAVRIRFEYSEEGFQKLTNPLIPGWAWAGFVLLFTYALANFGYFMVVHEVQPRTYEGKFALYHKSRLIREVSEAEFRDAEQLEVRGGSGHWMLFSAVPAFYFLYLYPRARTAAASETAEGDGTARALD
jgi:hypothetical protein